jgi:hypothetical protein
MTPTSLGRLFLHGLEGVLILTAGIAMLRNALWVLGRTRWPQTPVRHRGPRVRGEAMNPAIEHVLQFFRYDHLPLHLQEISKPFADLAQATADPRFVPRQVRSDRDPRPDRRRA